jgi:hypothetical protein
MIPQELIDKALALTGKTMEDMNEIDSYDANAYWEWCPWIFHRFSYPKFYAYLFEREVVSHIWNDNESMKDVYFRIWNSITEHQSWNEKPMIDLLSKI